MTAEMRIPSVTVPFRMAEIEAANPLASPSRSAMAYERRDHEPSGASAIRAETARPGLLAQLIKGYACTREGIRDSDVDVSVVSNLHLHCRLCRCHASPCVTCCVT